LTDSRSHELSDNDVETVVREVVLRKKPEYVPLLGRPIDAAVWQLTDN